MLDETTGSLGAQKPFEASAALFKMKEVIRPQVPLRTPCYNLAPLAEPRIDAPR